MDTSIIYNTDKIKLHNSFNLKEVYVHCGAMPRIAKTMATKVVKKLEIPVKAGLVDIAYIDLIIDEYKQRNGGKYKESMLRVLELIKTEQKHKLPKNIYLPDKNFETIDPFQAIFLLENLLDKLVEDENWELIAFFEQSVAEMRYKVD